MADLMIRNAAVLDGTGAPPRMADVTVEGGRITGIVEVGAGGTATREIDAGGLTLAPGFIDTHAHDDGAFFRHP
ncbi:MAG: D-aminoacylase, partial [Pseudomonadales bacterium]